MYLLKRLSMMVIVLFIVITITFTLVQFLPGKPYPITIARNPELVKILDEKYGLNDPALEKYTKYIGHLVQGDFGYSVVKNRNVNELVFSRIVVSMSIGFLPVIIGATVGVLVGVLSAIKRNTYIDYICTIIAVIGVSVPTFVTATFLQYYIAGELHLLPATFSARNAGLSVYVLPILVLSFASFAQIARFTRTEMIEALNSDYVVLAKAKGLKSRTVVFKHAFRNALVPIVTILPMTFLMTITGSLVIETIFNIPGLGRTLVEAINGNDYNTIMAVTTIYTILILTAYFITDILYVIIDPRIRVGGKKNG